MNALVPQNFGPVSTRFAGVAATDDLSAGVQAGFGIMGYKGKVWSLRKGGAETPLMRQDGDGPRNSIEVVILKASGHVSKIWYENGYVEGSTAAPDCFSANGVTPDAASKKRQSNACATCPMNQWGSRITPAGKQGKACSDSKRLAIAPLDDIKNEAFGGPLLLRVPAASLRDLATFGEKTKTLGYPYYAIGTRIAFDPTEAYPKFHLRRDPSLERRGSRSRAGDARGPAGHHHPGRGLGERSARPGAASRCDRVGFRAAADYPGRRVDELAAPGSSPAGVRRRLFSDFAA